MRLLGYKIAEGKVGNFTDTEVIENSMMTVVQRDFPRHIADCEKVVRLSRNKKQPIFYDIDDLLFYLPEDHPDFGRKFYREALVSMLNMVVEADFVVTPTLGLKNFLLNYRLDVRLLPNYFDDYIWKLAAPDLLKNPSGVVKIGYMGGTSHLPDLAIIKDPLLKISNELKGKIEFDFFGVDPGPVIGNIPDVNVTPYYSNDYPLFASFFQRRQADIFIAPLREIVFNQCKSPLKFFEYSAIGAPTVFSKMLPYLGVVQDGFDGFLAGNSDEWFEKIRQLVLDPELRFEMAQNAQSTIREHWLLSRHRTEIAQTFGLYE
jgi:glycosyltransferase involved in cell wall biosynthesis